MAAARGQQRAASQLGDGHEGAAGAHQSVGAPSAAEPGVGCVPGPDCGEVCGDVYLVVVSSRQEQVRVDIGSIVMVRCESCVMGVLVAVFGIKYSPCIEFCSRRIRAENRASVDHRFL